LEDETFESLKLYLTFHKQLELMQYKLYNRFYNPLNAFFVCTILISYVMLNKKAT